MKFRENPLYGSQFFFTWKQIARHIATGHIFAIYHYEQGKDKSVPLQARGAQRVPRS